MTSLNQSIGGQASKESANAFSLISTILQTPKIYFDEIRNNVDLSTKTLTLFLSAMIFLVIYGAILGSGHPLQAVSSAIKLPLVFLGSLIACTPTLYMFDVLFGARRSLGQTFTIILTAITVTALLLVSFSPITIIFSLTSNGYQFFKLLNVLFLGISTMVGLVYLARGLRQTSKPAKKPSLLEQTQEETETPKGNPLPFMIWFIMFVLVTAQIAWGLRPFVHYPGSNFIFRVASGNVIIEIGPALLEFLGFGVFR